MEIESYPKHEGVDVREWFARRTIGLVVAVFLIVPVLSGISVNPAAAAGTVGDGTAGSCTEQALRDAIVGGGLVTFDCPDETTITIEDEIVIAEDTEIHGDMDIFEDLSDFDGDMDNLDLTLEADGNRLFRMIGDVTFEISGLVLSEGNADGAGGAILNEVGSLEVSDVVFVDNQSTDEGGAIASNSGDVTIDRTLFVSNTSTENSGGAISVSGSSGDSNLSITGSYFFENSAEGLGGAISSFYSGGTPTIDIERSFFLASTSQAGGALYLAGPSSATIEESVLAANEASGALIPGNGGAIEVGSGDLEIVRSAIVDNTATGYGGGIARYGSGDVTIRQSTISGNTANGSNVQENVVGGGIYNNFEQSSGGSMTIVDSTIVENDAPNGFGDGIAARAETNITNTIVANNGDQDCAVDAGIGGSISSGGHNLSGDESCGFDEDTDIEDTDPMLGSLEPVGDEEDLLRGDGTATLVHFPLEGSPVIGAGPQTCQSPDQRGLSRPQGVNCDIGAVEVEMPADLCANRYNGDLRAPRTGSCASTEIPHYFVEQGSLDICVNRYNGDARFSRTGACASTEFAETIEGDGTFSVCVNRYNGDVRVPRSAGQCASTELSRDL